MIMNVHQKEKVISAWVLTIFTFSLKGKDAGPLDQLLQSPLSICIYVYLSIYPSKSR